jgi:hypothetical protein
MSTEPNQNRLRGTAYWLIVIAASLYAAFHFGFIIWQATRDRGWLVDEIVKKHYAAVIVLPSFGFASLCLIILLDQRSKDKMKFKALGFDFEGASGPIVLWIACFLACACALRLTW